MAYSALTTSEVGSGKPVTNGLLTKVKNNFDDHETRISQMEGENFGLSSNVGGVSTSSTSYVDATGLSQTITTNGGPVAIIVEPTSNTGGGDILLQNLSASRATSKGFIKFVRGSTDIAIFRLRRDIEANATFDTVLPPTMLFHVDHPAAGTYTYKVQFKADTANDSIGFENSKFLVEEL